MARIRTDTVLDICENAAQCAHAPVDCTTMMSACTSHSGNLCCSSLQHGAANSVSESRITGAVPSLVRLPYLLFMKRRRTSSSPDAIFSSARSRPRPQPRLPSGPSSPPPPWESPSPSGPYQEHPILVLRGSIKGKRGGKQSTPGDELLSLPGSQGITDHQRTVSYTPLRTQ